MYENVHSNLVPELFLVRTEAECGKGLCGHAYNALYNNQINARALIGRSALVYCANKPMEKFARPPNYYIKAIEHKFLWFI